MGRPPFKPTPKQRGFVEGATLAGFPQERIAKHLGISVNTMVKHFEAELEIKDQRLAALAETAYNIAMVDKNPAMVMFLLKTQLGWSERREIDITTGGEKLTWRDKVDAVKDAREAVKVFAEGVQGDE